MNRFHKIAVIVAALIFVANGQLIASNFTSEVVVNLDNTPLHVKHFEVYPSNTIINSSQSKAEEQSPEKEMRMWYWPRSIEELCDLYPVGSKPYVKDQEDFLAGKTKRNPNEDYIVLVDKVRFHFDSCEYEFVKFLRFKGGRLAGSGVGCFTIGEARRYTMITSMPAIFMKFNSFFWETEARGFAYLLYGDESLLNLQANGKKNITDRLFEIRKSCLTESGEFSPVKFFERAKSIRRYGDPIEQTALEHLMVQPVKCFN